MMGMFSCFISCKYMNLLMAFELIKALIVFPFSFT